MDKTELGCLRAIVLFNPGKDLSCPTSTLRTKSPGVSFIKLSVDFILKVYVRTKARFCVQQNLRKKPFINPSQGKIVRTCISTPTPPRNNHVWRLQRLVLLCITSSACHFHAYYHPRDTMFNTVKGTRR